MNAIHKAVLAVTATIIVAADAHAGRWLSRDPIEDGAGFVQRDPLPQPQFISQQRNEPNLYAFVRNNPIDSIDLLGLLVTGAYDLNTGNLVITDVDTGETIILCGESGGKPFGDPIPTGEWEILDHPTADFFRLDAVDSTPRNDIHEPTGRDHFRLHKPGRTIGCIAAKPECGDCWNKVRDLIRKTKTVSVTVTTQRKWPLSPIQETLKKFGDFRVVDTSKGARPDEKFKPCECHCKDGKK
jgi:hypothetical protein